MEGARLGGVPFDAKEKGWAKFARALATGKPDKLEPRGKLGIFGLGARRLEKLGVMTDVHKVTGDGKPFYMGRFVAPLTLAKFLDSPKLQYKVFCQSMKDYRKQLHKSKLDKELGKEIDGEPLTLSGLLGLSSAAGIKGAKSWLKNPADRERFPHTTETFLKTNGLF